jgi:hypothetical protein
MFYIIKVKKKYLHQDEIRKVVELYKRFEYLLIKVILLTEVITYGSFVEAFPAVEEL